MDKVLVGDYVGTDGVRYNRSNPGPGLGDGALPVKYGEDPGDTGQSSGIDFILLRYADVLTLMSDTAFLHGSQGTFRIKSFRIEIRMQAALFHKCLVPLRIDQSFGFLHQIGLRLIFFPPGNLQ